MRAERRCTGSSARATARLALWTVMPWPRSCGRASRSTRSRVPPAAEAKVQEAADELVAVNDALAEEIDERDALEHRMSQTDSELIMSRAAERKASNWRRTRAGSWR